MAAFKQHCAFTFWLAALLPDPKGILEAVGEKSSMGHLGKISGINDLPADDVFISYLREAMALNEQGAKPLKKEKTAKKEIEVPAEFNEALNANSEALNTFQNFSPSHRREYLEWITEAKTEATRNKRIASSIEMLSEGKSRHWKHQKK